MRARLSVMPVAALLAFNHAGAAEPRAAHAGNAAECAALAKAKLPNATVALAEPVTDGSFAPPGVTNPIPRLPPFCRVAGEIAPTRDSHIRFEVWLPLGDSWTGRFVGVGNGGWAGTISYTALAQQLRRGNAVGSTDTGHQDAAPGIDQAKFAFQHPEQYVDFQWRAVHEMTVIAKRVTSEFYGKPITHTYWVGCSTGGRQGLMEAQRFPDDYDGVLAGAPANNWTHLMAGSLAISVSAVDSATRLTRTDLELVQRAVTQACDTLDGVADGVLEDPRRCTFDVSTLKCSDPRAHDACLSAAQIETVRRTYGGLHDPKTRALIYAGFPVSGEIGWAVMMNPSTPFPVALAFYKWIVFRDSTWDWRTFDLARPADYAAYQKSETANASAMNATSTDLSRFTRRGGKLIQYHGWTDQLITPLNSIDYYNSLVSASRAGRDNTDVASFYRLYMVPGMGHCAGGLGTSSFDLQSALEAWVEQKTAPQVVNATHSTNGTVDRSRPLCPYPKRAIYKGAGDTNDAANFVCAES